MSNNNFAETLASVASEFGVEDTAKHGRGIKPSKRPYFRWTDEQLEQLEQLATLRDEGKSANEIAEALGVSRDKVITKLAAMAARQRAKPEAVREQIKQAEQEPSTEPVPEVSTEPVALDRIIFAAFSEFIGLVDNYDRTAGCWRKALQLIEKQLDGCTAMIAQHPETEPHLCKIAAIIAFDELKA